MLTSTNDIRAKILAGNNDAVRPLCVTVTDAHTYMHTQMAADLENFRASGQVKTGFANLDELMKMYPGLYVVGAISSLGKTTFVLQLCDQIAAAGEIVIYVTLEQTTLELVTKILARKIAQHDLSNALSSLQIRQDESDPRVQAAVEEFDQYAQNMYIYAGSFATTVNDIARMVERVIDETGCKPIVVVDYLQALQPVDLRMSSKDAVDKNVRVLKDLQSEHQLIMIAISSLNRQNYMTAIDFDSYKESGGIEYTADVVWGLQLQVVHDTTFDSAGKTNTKREMIMAAKAATPRQIELVCLKNRFGISSYTCYYDYYPNADLFVPQPNRDLAREQRVHTIEFLPLDYDDPEMPF